MAAKTAVAKTAAQYTIKRFFYRNNKDIESNDYYKVISVGFAPCSYSECVTLLSKLSNYKAAGITTINKIVAV